MKLQSASRQELQSISEAPKLEVSGASDRQSGSEARVVSIFRASVKLRSASRQELHCVSLSSEARVVRRFRAPVKLQSASRQEIHSASEAPKLETSGASERQ